MEVPDPGWLDSVQLLDGTCLIRLRRTLFAGLTWGMVLDASGELADQIALENLASKGTSGRIKATRDEHMERRRSVNPTKHFYMLKHILRCAHCGTWLSGLFHKQQSKNHYYCPKKERVWAKRPPELEDKWKRGRVCEMTRSLPIEATDELVWNSVLDAISKSTLMREEVRKKVLTNRKKILEGTLKTEKDQVAKIKALKKHIAKLDDNQTHWLEIQFKIPLVGDFLVYKDPKQKALGYSLKDGVTALMVEQVSRPYSKKKPIETRA